MKCKLRCRDYVCVCVWWWWCERLRHSLIRLTRKPIRAVRGMIPGTAVAPHLPLWLPGVLWWQRAITSVINKENRRNGPTDGLHEQPVRNNSKTTCCPSVGLMLGRRHLKLCLADAIHNFKWVKIIQIWQNESQLFQILLVDDTYLKCGT